MPVAAALAALPGLRWKIWLMNEAAGEGGGISLFEGEAARQAYIDDALSVGQSDPTMRDITYKVFDVLEEHSAITRGPVGHGVRV